MPDDQFTQENIAVAGDVLKENAADSALAEKLKTAEAENAVLASSLESLVQENSDTLERIAGLEAEIDGLKKSAAREHEKRRLHLLNVRDLKKAISERDQKITTLEAELSESERRIEELSTAIDSAVRKEQAEPISIVSEQPLPAGNILEADSELLDQAPQIASLREELELNDEEQPIPLPEFKKTGPQKIKFLKKSKETGKYIVSETPPEEDEAAIPPSSDAALQSPLAPENKQSGIEAIFTPPPSASMIKALQTDIFYKEIEIDRLNSLLGKEQSDIMSLKDHNDELKRQTDILKDELSTREAQILRLEERCGFLEEETANLNEKYRDLDPLELEKLRMMSDVKDYLESELDRKAGKEGMDDEDDETPEKEVSEAPAAGAGAEEKPAQIRELEEIKEKFQKLIKERDEAIALLDKFEMESRTKDAELKKLKLEHKNLKNDHEALNEDFKKKDEELGSIYGAFSKYKEESGFMSREYKTIKDERDRLLAEIKTKTELLHANQESIDAKEAELKKVSEFNEKLIEKLKKDHENVMAAVVAEKETEIKTMVFAHEAEMQKMAEEGRAEFQQLRSSLETIDSKYQGAISETHNMRANLETLFMKINGFLARPEEERDGFKRTVFNEVLFLYDQIPELGASQSGSEQAVNSQGFVAPLPDVYYKVFNSLKPLPEFFYKIFQEFGLEVKYAKYIDFITSSEKPKPCVAIFANIKTREDILKVFEIAALDPGSPIVLFCDNANVSVAEIVNAIISGAACDYIDGAMSEGIVANVLARVFEKRIHDISGVVVEKDSEECKLRESVVLTIDNRVKANRIETLIRRLDYLRENNAKMMFNLKEMQKAFDQIIAIVTNLTMLELPDSISDGFNEITDILLKISFIK